MDSSAQATTSCRGGQQLRRFDQHVGQHLLGKVVPWRAHPEDGADSASSKHLIESGASSIEDIPESSIAGLVNMTCSRPADHSTTSCLPLGYAPIPFLLPC
jgi:hypothetical protein